MPLISRLSPLPFLVLSTSPLKSSRSNIKRFPVTERSSFFATDLMRLQAPGRRCYSSKRASQGFGLLLGVLERGFRGGFRSNLCTSPLYRYFCQNKMIRQLLIKSETPKGNDKEKRGEPQENEHLGHNIFHSQTPDDNVMISCQGPSMRCKKRKGLH